VARKQNNGKRRPARPKVRTSFTPRVIAVTLFILFVFLGWMFFWMLFSEHHALVTARQDGLAEQVRMAVSICEHFQARMEAGEFTRDEAIEQSRLTLTSLRYGQLSEGYFYILDRQGQMVAHPLRPELAGEDLRDLTDAGGKRFIEVILNTPDHGPGRLVTYRWQWLNSATDMPELMAYVEGFEPWNWYIVTEVQTADINARIIGDLARQVGILFMLTLALAGVLAVTLQRQVLSGVDRLIEVARRLAAGDLSARTVISPTDEMKSLSVAINQMAEGIQARDEQVRLTQRTAVFALAKLAEARDRETGGHLLRVREYSKLLAQELANEPNWREIITPQFINDIYDASLLHDVGKVAVPDAILLKPDTLDEGEMAIMMSHTLVGANTIRAARQRMKAESSFLIMAEQIARSHHERWNGKGYVECLSGEDIPPAARIFSIVDVYDALTTERPYKQAYTHAQAIELMQEERGQRFDPSALDAFFRAADKFNAIRAEFADESAA